MLSNAESPLYIGEATKGCKIAILKDTVAGQGLRAEPLPLLA
jgi:hypothetical protein